MSNTSVNLEKQRAAGLVGVGRIMGIRWCAGETSMLLICTPLNIREVCSLPT